MEDSAASDEMEATVDTSMIARIDAVLSAFDLGHSTLGLSPLARRAELPKATVHRVAGQLVDRGYLERDDLGYRLGVRLFELGQQVTRSRVLRDAALPFLEDLFVASRETVHLAVASGDQVMYIEKIVGHSSGRTPSEVAGKFPLHSTATGKAILAHQDRDEIDRYLARPMERITRHTIVVPEVLRTELDVVRRTGWSVEREETLVGFVSVAAPVFDRDGNVLAALSVTGPGGRLDPDRLGPSVRTAARELSRVLAGESPLPWR